MTQQTSTITTYQYSRDTRELVIPFDYLRRDFVEVSIQGPKKLQKVLTLGVDYKFTTKTTITVLRTYRPEEGFDMITLRRVTDASKRIINFQDGSVLNAYELNVSQIQSIHIAEEARNLATYQLGITDDGSLDARGRRLINVGEPINNSDAATKGYVDGTIGLSKGYAQEAKEATEEAKRLADTLRPSIITYSPLRKCKVHSILKFEVPNFYPQGITFDNEDRMFYLMCSSSGIGEKLLVAKFTEDGSFVENKELPRTDGVSYYFGEGAQLVKNEGSLFLLVTAMKKETQEYGVGIYNYKLNTLTFKTLPYVTTSQICTSPSDLFGVEERLYIRYGTYTRFRFYSSTDFVKGTIKELGQVELESDLGTESKIQSTCLMDGSIYSGVGKTTNGVVKYSLDGSVLESMNMNVNTLLSLCGDKIDASLYKDRYTENEGIGVIHIAERAYVYTSSILETTTSKQHCAIILHGDNVDGTLLKDSTAFKQSTMTQFAPFVIKGDFPKNLKYYINDLIERKVYYGALYTSNVPVKWSETQPFVLPNYCFVEFKMNNLITCNVDIHCDDGIISLQYLKTKGTFRLIQGLSKTILMSAEDLWGPTPIDLAHTVDLTIKIYPYTEQSGRELDFKKKFINVPAGSKVTLIKSISSPVSNMKIKGILSRDTIDSTLIPLEGNNYPTISAVCVDSNSRGYNWYKIGDTTVSKG